MEEGSDFYVVRKGNTVAIYKNLSDCQAQVSSSVHNAPVSVYKGHAWSKETEESLISLGLKNPLYTIDASDLKKDLFGSLTPCSFQDVVSFGSDKDLKRKSSASDAGASDSFNNFKDKHAIDSSLTGQNKRHCKVLESIDLTVPVESAATSITNNALCILHFDGASKGNPGKAGAGALLKTEDGKLICRLSEGLGVATNNVAEYKALLLGLRYALMKGFKRIKVKGDSMLVVMQVQGKWKVKHKDMIELCKEVGDVKKKFISFHIEHVRREFNSDADHQANLAIDLLDGHVSEVLGAGF